MERDETPACNFYPLLRSFDEETVNIASLLSDLGFERVILQATELVKAIHARINAIYNVYAFLQFMFFVTQQEIIDRIKIFLHHEKMIQIIKEGFGFHITSTTPSSPRSSSTTSGYESDSSESEDSEETDVTEDLIRTQELNCLSEFTIVSLQIDTGKLGSIDNFQLLLKFNFTYSFL